MSILGKLAKLSLGGGQKGDETTMERNKKSVLVVDSDSTLRCALSFKLVSAGFKVYDATNGYEALEQMVKHPFDVVLTDCRMPGVDGLEFLSICRAKWPETPVVVFSGEQDDLALTAVERGAFAWVRKGSEFTLLLQILTHATQRSVHV